MLFESLGLCQLACSDPGAVACSLCCLKACLHPSSRTRSLYTMCVYGIQMWPPPLNVPSNTTKQQPGRGGNKYQVASLWRFVNMFHLNSKASRISEQVKQTVT